MTTTTAFIVDTLHAYALELDHHRTTLLTDDDNTELLGLILDKPAEYLPDNSVITATAIRTELHRRALAEYTAGGDDSPQARRDLTRRTAIKCTIATLNAEANDRTDGYTRRVALDRLHILALADHVRHVLHHIADLIRAEKVNGEDIADMVNALDWDENNPAWVEIFGVTGTYEATYRASVTLGWSASDVLDEVTRTVLGW